MAVAVEVVDAETFVRDQVVESASRVETTEEAALRRGLSLLSLARPADDAVRSTRERWARVGASYFADQRKIVVLDRGYVLDGPAMSGLLVHEYVHALQHADPSVDHAAHRGSYDEELAFRGMTEGQAVLYQDLALVDGFGRSEDDFAWDELFGQFRRRVWDEARRAEAPYELARRYFPYAFGGHFVSRAHRDSEGAAHDAVTAPPTSTRAVLAGPGSVVVAESEELDEVAVPALPAELEHVATRRLGAWIFASFWSRWRGDEADASGEPDIGGYADDVFTVFLNRETEDVVVAWRLRFEDAAGAEQVAASLAADPLLTHSVLERDLVVVGDTRGAPLAGFVQRLVWRPAVPDDWTAASGGAASALAGAEVWGCESLADLAALGP